MKRRDLIKRLSALPLVGGLIGTEALAGNMVQAPVPDARRDYYKELGLRTYINAAGTYTFLTGCLMREEAIDAQICPQSICSTG